MAPRSPLGLSYGAVKSTERDAMSKAWRRKSTVKAPSTPLFTAKKAEPVVRKVSGWVEREDKIAADHMRAMLKLDTTP